MAERSLIVSTLQTHSTHTPQTHAYDYKRVSPKQFKFYVALERCMDS